MPTLRHARVEHVEPLLALAAADDLADARRQHVHRRDRLAVVVHAHVERLDVLRVVHDDHRLLRVLLGEIALVLGLQVDAPLHRELELLLRALEDRDRLAVVHAHELGRRRCPASFATMPFLDALVEEGESSGRSFSSVSKVYFSSRSASVASSERSANAISGSIIQNSARWRLVLEFSARNVGPKV